MTIQAHDELRPAAVHVTTDDRRTTSAYPPHDMRGDFSGLDYAAAAMAILMILGPLAAGAFR